MSPLQGPLWCRSAVDLARAITSTDVSSREVVEAHLQRTAEVNPGLNAITVLLADAALDAADEADRKRERREPLGPLHGVPFTIKEEIDVVGSATTDGVVAHKDQFPNQDAPVVARMKAAGAIPIGRTNMPDFGMRLHTSNALWGATLNPWDPSRTPGGSSGGEAAALATGMTPLGIGADIGGSLRNPSYCCGTTALKPGLGRLPQAYYFAPSLTLAEQLMGVCGPMARHVSDLRLALEVMAGVDVRDPWSVPAPLDGPPLEPPIRVAVVPEPAGGPTDPVVAAGVRAAADALADAGYAVEEVSPPNVPEIARLWAGWLSSEPAPGLEDAAEIMSGEALRFLLLSAAGGGEAPSLESLAHCLSERGNLGVEWAEFLALHPLVLGPVWTQRPWQVGYDVAGEAQARDVLEQVRLTVVANFLGLPSVALPVGEEDGLPRGVQVMGGRFREDLCLEAARAIEERVGAITPIDPRLTREA